MSRGSPTGVVDADNETADDSLIAIHGREGIKRKLLDSVTERVVRTSPVPLLTVAR